MPISLKKRNRDLQVFQNFLNLLCKVICIKFVSLKDNLGSL